METQSLTDDPTGLVGAVKDAFRERVKAWQAWQSLQEFKALFTEILRDNTIIYIPNDDKQNCWLKRNGGGGSAHNKNLCLSTTMTLNKRSLINKSSKISRKSVGRN